ncbi:MAG: hypothetical protein NVS4B11_29290 [Ktedonobacteraceae bacterium]
MTQEERIAQLEQENAELRKQLAKAYQQITQLSERLQRVEGQLVKDSHNSSKPPSSDGLKRKPRSQRQRSEKQTGGQPGHPGCTLMQVTTPDEVVQPRPMVCMHCQQPLEGVVGQLKERRQVHDLPEIRLLVREHQVEQVCCPACQAVSQGSFPAEVEAPVQYGAKLRALGVYLHEYQLVPLARVSELLTDLCGCEVSEGTVLTWVQGVAERLAPVVGQIADWLSVSPLQHADETGVRIAGKLHWLHVNSTHFLTHLAWHSKRGRKALEDIGIWPRFGGRSMRDRWVSYDHYGCAQSICGAHLVRDCVYVGEQEQQLWATEMADLLLSMAGAADEWRKLGADAVPLEERDAWIAHYARPVGQWLCDPACTFS